MFKYYIPVEEGIYFCIYTYYLYYYNLFSVCVAYHENQQDLSSKSDVVFLPLSLAGPCFGLSADGDI